MTFSSCCDFLVWTDELIHFFHRYVACFGKNRCCSCYLRFQLREVDLLISRILNKICHLLPVECWHHYCIIVGLFPNSRFGISFCQNVILVADLLLAPSLLLTFTLVKYLATRLKLRHKVARFSHIICGRFLMEPSTGGTTYWHFLRRKFFSSRRW